MGAFVSLLPHAPTETPTQAYDQGLQSGLGAQAMMQQQQQRAGQMQLTQQEIQQRQLANDEAQRKAAATQAFNSTLGNYVSQGPGGIPIVDWGGAAADLAKQGHGGVVPDMVTQAYKDHDAQIAMAKTKAARLGQLAGSVSDDATKDHAVDQAQQEGLIDASTASEWKGQTYDQLKPVLAQSQQAALTADQQLDLAQRANTFNHTLAMDAPKSIDEWSKVTTNLLQGAHDQDSLDRIRTVVGSSGAPQTVVDALPTEWNADTEKQIKMMGVPKKDQPIVERNDLDIWSQKLQAGAGISKEAYARAYGMVPGDLQPFFPDPATYDPAKTPDLVAKAGMTPTAMITAESAAAYRNMTADQREERINQQWQRLQDQEEIQRLSGGRDGGQTPNSQAVDQRQALTDYRKLQLRESALNKQRTAIGQAMNQAHDTGQIPTDKNGTPRDLDSEFEQATNDLAEVLNDKYGAAERAKMGAPSVPLDDALKAIGRGSGGGTSQPAGGAPKPTASAAPQTNPAKMTEADARAKATAAHKDPDWYVRELKKRGLLQ